MKIFKAIDLRFKNNEKEAEYKSVRGVSFSQDYQVIQLFNFTDFIR